MDQLFPNVLDNCIYKGVLECPLFNLHLVCHYTGTCKTCPIRLLLHLYNHLLDSQSDNHLALTLRKLIRDYYKI